MPTMFKVGSRWLNVDQMRAWRAEQNRLNATFCHWCTSKGGRHTKNCLTKSEGFDPEVTPKLTEEERNNITTQKDEVVNKGESLVNEPTSAKGELHDNDGKA